jgi:hypothetical protein
LDPHLRCTAWRHRPFAAARVADVPKKLLGQINTGKKEKYQQKWLERNNEMDAEFVGLFDHLFIGCSIDLPFQLYKK